MIGSNLLRVRERADAPMRLRATVRAQNFDVTYDLGGRSVGFTAASCDPACTAIAPCSAVTSTGGTSVWVFVGVVAGALALWGLAVLAYIVWKRRRGEVPVFSLVAVDDDDGGGGGRGRTRMPVPLPGMGEGGTGAAGAPAGTAAAALGASGGGGGRAAPPGTLGAGRHIALSVEGLEMGALLGAPKDAAGEDPRGGGERHAGGGGGARPGGGADVV